METQPTPLDAIAAANGGLDAFRLTSPTEIARVLRLVQDASTLVNLNAPQGSVYTTTLWTADAHRGALSFAADAGDPHGFHPHSSTRRPNWPRSPPTGLVRSASTWPDSSNFKSSSVMIDSSLAGLIATR